MIFSVNCIWSTWSAWGTCDSGSGFQERNRTILQGALNGGTGCTGNATKTQDCPGRALLVFIETFTFLSELISVACSWSTWGSWGSCSKSCGSGTMTRTRSKDGPLNGGTDCSGSSSSSATCNTNGCPGRQLLPAMKLPVKHKMTFTIVSK